MLLETAALRIKGFSKLTEEQKSLFLRVHKSHMKAFGTENKKKYAIEKIKKIVWDKEEHTVNVYYKDVWWHYDSRGCWY